MSNRLKNETSPYLLAHANNPVNWYAWGEEAFARAKEQDKPIFLSIGYSTCHWCHVMARESFEDREIADLLNRSFIAVKVDKEERPDIDSIYMRVCQAFTGSGGWPTSIFITADQKPFFAGTYFPKHSRGGMVGLYELLATIAEQWATNRRALLRQAEDLTAALRELPARREADSHDLLQDAMRDYARSYDARYGGFGMAPKFPTPHHLLFLMAYGSRRGDQNALSMAEHTLLQMARGGLFDHVGGGFCRYSTDRRFLAPHFEKMLYDNALLILAYATAYTHTRDRARADWFLRVAERTAEFLLREMTAPEGGFYSARDADSDGEEGKYYLFTPEEIARVLGEESARLFCDRYDVTERGNFEGKSIPNRLHGDPFDRSAEPLLAPLYDYRKQRVPLHTDEKILTAWNGLAIAAFCVLYRCTGKPAYRAAAERAEAMIRERLWDKQTLYASYAAERRGAKGFLDDYAAMIFAELALYGATLDPAHRNRAEQLWETVDAAFHDAENGGFYLYAADAEALLLRPKETYDGAMPSGNSMMAWNLVRLYQFTQKEAYRAAAEEQLAFLANEAADYPMGHAMFLLALLTHEDPITVTVVPDPRTDRANLPLLVPPEAAATVLSGATDAYPLKDGKTTFYVCRGHRCDPPTNEWKPLSF